MPSISRTREARTSRRRTRRISAALTETYIALYELGREFDPFWTDDEHADYERRERNLSRKLSPAKIRTKAVMA